MTPARARAPAQRCPIAGRSRFLRLRLRIPDHLPSASSENKTGGQEPRSARGRERAGTRARGQANRGRGEDRERVRRMRCRWEQRWGSAVVLAEGDESSVRSSDIRGGDRVQARSRRRAPATGRVRVRRAADLRARARRWLRRSRRREGDVASVCGLRICSRTPRISAERARVAASYVSLIWRCADAPLTPVRAALPAGSAGQRESPIASRTCDLLIEPSTVSTAGQLLDKVRAALSGESIRLRRFSRELDDVVRRKSSSPVLLVRTARRGPSCPHDGLRAFAQMLSQQPARASERAGAEFA